MQSPKGYFCNVPAQKGRPRYSEEERQARRKATKDAYAAKLKARRAEKAGNKTTRDSETQTLHEERFEEATKRQRLN